MHNAAAGYWTIGAGSMAPATATAGAASFAQGLLEAAQRHAGADAVLLVAYDIEASGLLGAMTPSEGCWAGVAPATVTASGRVHGRYAAAAEQGPLARHAGGNAMAPMLPLFDALAAGGDLALLQAGPGSMLRVELAHG